MTFRSRRNPLPPKWIYGQFIECLFCNFITYSEEFFEEHVEQRHKFSTAITLDKEEELAFKSLTPVVHGYKCDLCNFWGSLVHLLLVHIRQNHFTEVTVKVEIESEEEKEPSKVSPIDSASLSVQLKRLSLRDILRHDLPHIQISLERIQMSKSMKFEHRSRNLCPNPS